MSHGPRIALLGLGFAALTGCSQPPEVPTSGNGELHQGSFVYTCSSSSDAASCGPNGAPTLPTGIALGADFGLRYEPSAAEEHALEPSASFFTVDATTGRLHTARAGYGVVLVTNDKGDVIDFVNLRVKTIATLTVAGVDPDTSLVVGETRTLDVTAFDAVGEPLAGTLALEWESSDPAVATVTVTDTDRSLGTATVHTVAPGTARLRVVAGTTTGTISIKVGS